MNFALFEKPLAFAPLQDFVRWMTSARPPTNRPAVDSSPNKPTFAPDLIATRAVSTRADSQKLRHCKPLRVVRVMEAGQARTCVGRMVISGRMADVCAELDRLVAREAALGCQHAG